MGRVPQFIGERVGAFVEGVKHANLTPMPRSAPIGVRVDIEVLRERTAAVLPGIVELRRALHRDPETRFSEKATAHKIRAVGSRVASGSGDTPSLSRLYPAFR